MRMVKAGLPAQAEAQPASGRWRSSALRMLLLAGSCLCLGAHTAARPLAA